MSIALAPHCITQAKAKGIDPAAVLAVANNPTITYGSFQRMPDGSKKPYVCKKCGLAQKKYTGTAGGKSLCVVVNECCGIAITVWLDQVETAIRPDQAAKGVTGYYDRNGHWHRG